MFDSEQNKAIKIKCKQCGREFKTWPAWIRQGRKYCSRKCADESRKGKPTWNKNMREGKVLICQMCGKEYYANPKRVELGSKYCSWGCFNISKTMIKGENHPLYTKVTIKCDYCGKEYSEKPANIKNYNKHFCSRRCVGCYFTSQYNNPSSIEIKLSDALKQHSIPFVSQFAYQMGIADFFIEPDLIVEVDGDYWHNIPKVKERDKKQTAFLTTNGYRVLHLTESEINKNMGGCIDRIIAIAEFKQ